MKELFQNLSGSERDLLIKGPLLVNILVAGADGKIEKKERKVGFDFIHQRGNKLGNNLETFYHHLTENLNLIYTEIIQTLPRGFEERNKEIVKLLGKFNAILSKLEKSFAEEYYQSLRQMASNTAKASGGVGGLSSVNDKEKKYIILPMIIDPHVQESPSEELKKIEKL